MRFPLRHDLGLQLLTLYLLFVGPVVLAAVIFNQFASQKIEADAKSADLALARAIAQETNSATQSALQAVRQLSTYPAVIEGDHQGMKALFRMLLNARPDINLVYRLDAEGIMAYHYPEGPGVTVGWDFSRRDYYMRALTSHSPLFSLGRKSPTTNQPVATAVMPIWSAKGEFLGVVATNIKLQSLSHTLASIAAEHRVEEGFEVMIIDAGGTIIAHPKPDLLLTNQASVLPHITQDVLNGQSGNGVDTPSGGEERLYSYVPVPSAGWGVIASRTTRAALATQRSFQQGLAAAVAFFLAVGILFWLVLSRRVIKPLELLGTFSQKIGEGRSIPYPQRIRLAKYANRSDQIGRLSNSLIRMEQDIQSRIKELSTLVQISATVVSTLDSPSVLNRILEAVEHLTNVQMSAIVGLDERQNMFRARASRGLSPRYVQQLAIDPAEPQSVTLRAIRTGQPVQISDTENDPSFSAFRPRSRSEGYRSILAVPLNLQHAPASALLVYRKDPHIFSQEEINLLTSFANHAAMAIENAALFERSDLRLKEETRRLEALIQSLQDGLVLEDLKGRILYANRRISEIVDIPLQELANISVHKIFNRILSMSLQEEEARQAIETILGGSGERAAELSLLVAGRNRSYNLQIFDVTDSNGMLIGRGHILQDITQGRELDRMKSSLISTVSHELRTPLASIKGYASTLLAEDVTWDVASEREFLEIISAETDHLTELVNDLLDMSRIDAGNLTVTRSECSLIELVRSAATRSHPQPRERLRFNLPEDLPPLYADPQRMESVLRNLIENAAKYAGEESPIWVSANVESDCLIVRVEDDGPGIPIEHSQRIFERFYRLSDELNSETPGVGLGLAISRGFIQAHGGKIWLEPRPKGTCVAFSIPRGPEEMETGEG